MYIRICLVCILFLGMLSTPITVSADEEKSTNIEIEQTWHYDPNTNIYSGFMSNAGDDDDDIVVGQKSMVIMKLPAMILFSSFMRCHSVT